MSHKPLPSAEYVRSRLDYNQNTGEFRWKALPGSDITARRWNGRWVGKVAGADSHGYIAIRLTSATVQNRDAGYVAHRLAWLWMTGEVPPEEVDHKNHNRRDNRFSNLRLAKREENAANRGANRNSKSGIRGVSWQKQRGYWRAVIGQNGKPRHLGDFATKEAAAEAYRKEAIRLHGEFKHESV